MPPLTVMVKPVSSLCNMRCSYCFYEDVAEHWEIKTHEKMQHKTLEALVRRAFAYADEQISFIFQGGEPTLSGAPFYKHLLSLQRIYNSRSLKVINAIQTNGYLLDDDLLDVLKQGHFLTGVSLDGPQSIHDAYRINQNGEGTYDQVQETIRKLRQRGIDYNILCVVNQAIAMQPIKIFSALKEYGNLQFIPCLDSLDGIGKPFSLQAETYGYFLIETFRLYKEAFYKGKFVSIRTFDNFLAMLNGLPPDNCAMNGHCMTNFLIEADGSVYPCDFYVLDKWRMGSILDSSFYKLEKSQVVNRFMAMSDILPGECKSCRWLALCRGGCRRDREPFVDGRFSKNRLCKSYKYFFETCHNELLYLAKAVAQ